MIVRTNKGACVVPNFGTTTNTTKNEINVPVPAVNVTVLAGSEEMATNNTSNCCTPASSSQSLCFQVDKNGKPIDPASGLPYISPTRQSFDPPPPQTQIPDEPGKGSDGVDTIIPDPPGPSPYPPSPPATDQEEFLEFPCNAFLLYGPDAPSFTLRNASVKSQLIEQVRTVAPNFRWGMDKLIAANIDCEGLSYDGVSVLPQQTTPWTFTDYDGVKPVQSRIDRRGLGNYTVNVRVDSDRSLGLYLGPEGASDVTVSGQFAQGPNLPGIGVVSAAYCRAAICSAVVKWGSDGCTFDGEYIVKPADLPLDNATNQTLSGPCTWQCQDKFGNPGNWLFPIGLVTPGYFGEAPEFPSLSAEVIAAGDYNAPAEMRVVFYHDTPSLGPDNPFLSASWDLLGAGQPGFDQPIDQFFIFASANYRRGEGFKVQMTAISGRPILIQIRFHPSQS